MTRRKIIWSKLYSFSCIPHLRGQKHDQVGNKGYSRVVYCNDPDNPEAIQLNYMGNYVSTTKYTVANFIPKSLFEQFRRVANIYFLVVSCVSFSPLAPYSALSVLAPLVVVIGATMAKEAVEDWRRRKQDIEANNRRAYVFHKDQTFHETRWKYIRVGDLVKVHKDDYFPADLCLISSSYEDGICYVETMNLDGETNLKLKQSLEVTSSLQDETSLKDFRAVIKCEDPNENLYSFVGNLHIDDTEYPLSLSQILLRDSKLKNTEYIHGVVVFTGHDTKVMRNATEPPSKRSKIELRMDKIIYILFSTLVLISFVGSFFLGFETKRDLSNGESRRWYLRPDKTTVFYDPKRAPLAAFFHFLTGLMLYGYLIPISLYVSIEIVKVLQAIFINQDRDMYYPVTDKPAHARTSNLNEELGQIDTVLSDKTGTLTCNSMEFVKCSIAGSAYGRVETQVEKAIAKQARHETSEISSDDTKIHPSGKSIKGFNFQDERIMGGQWINEPNRDLIRMFFRVLAICHTVIPDVDKETSEIHYEAESPDEAAFVVAAKEIGFKFSDRKQTSVSVHEMDFTNDTEVERKYEILHVLEFSSSRKRMSVIVRNEEGQLLLLSKGSDSAMFERLSKDGRHFEVETKHHIKEYSEAGLRTLVIAYRELVKEEFEEWQKEFLRAKASITADRDDMIDAAADKIERDLILLGATAVEDRLQEGVPECIDRLAQAGIKVWVLTGDKLETAVNIGYACKLLRQGMELITITLENQKDSVGTISSQINEAKSRLESFKEKSTSFGLVIDGKSLDFALKKDLEDSFFDLAVHCSSVICCRSSPKQKALKYFR